MIFLYEVISYRDKEKWLERLHSLPKRDVFYFHQYCTPYIEMGDGEPHLFVYWDDEGNYISYCFFKRPITGFQNGEVYDIITPPYGYGGPLYERADFHTIKQFRQEFADYCQREKIISEFIRFHPMYQNHELMKDTMDVFFDRETIFIDLTKTEEEIMENFHRNHKRNVKKALKNRLDFVVIEGKEALEVAEEFYEMYKETMDKVKAKEYSYFSLHYIKEFLQGLNEHSLIAAIYYEGKMVAAALCIHDSGIIHYHLGCSKKEYLHLGINVYLFYRIIIWAKQYGQFQFFHLGGGHVGRDSLFQFKYKFNLQGALGFYIGKKIHDEDKYEQLVIQWENLYKEERNVFFFPAYRAKPSKEHAVLVNH